jgi:hypothetical protein
MSIDFRRKPNITIELTSHKKTRTHVKKLQHIVLHCNKYQYHRVKFTRCANTLYHLTDTQALVRRGDIRAVLAAIGAASTTCGSG